MKIKVEMTPDQYKSIGQALFDNRMDASVSAFLKDAFDLASKKAVRLFNEGCALTEIQEMFLNEGGKNERTA